MQKINYNDIMVHNILQWFHKQNEFVKLIVVIILSILFIAAIPFLILGGLVYALIAKIKGSYDWKTWKNTKSENKKRSKADKKLQTTDVEELSN